MDQTGDAFNRALGERLRRVRKQRGYSLLEVEEVSGGEFKASVLGAYERGERAMSVVRLIRLADIYEVHPSNLLPVPPPGDQEEVVLDLEVAERLDPGRAAVLDGFLSAIQRMRQDPAGPTLTVRKSDLRVLSALLTEAMPSGEFSDVDDR